MFGCEEKELAQLGRDGEEKRGSVLNVKSAFGTDSNTGSSGEGLLDLNCGVRGGCRFVHLCKGGDKGIAYFDILDTVFE